MSALVDISRYDDVGCPWCYSAEPVRLALETRYGDQLRWRTVQVGLHASSAAMSDGGYTPAGLADGYRVFHGRHGMPFCLAVRPRLVPTCEAARAVKAAERQGRGAALERRLRLAYFAETRLLDERGEILGLAAEAGLDTRRLAADLEDPATEAALEADMREAYSPDRVARKLGKTAASRNGGDRYTTPSYVLSSGGRNISVPGFQPLGAYEVALHNLAAGLERRRAASPVDFLLERPGELYAAAELAAASELSERRALRELEAAASAGALERHPAGAGDFWSAGPARVQLSCPETAHRFPAAAAGPAQTASSIL
jgi:predicted DsbA family dithiol-disulfide isomerase